MKKDMPLVKGNFIGFSVKVAEVFGLNEAIFLNQLHYWTQRSNNKRDGFIWVYKTVDEWRAEFPFWSERTIKRIKKNLEEQKLIITANYNKMKIDRTLWYRINYELLEKLLKNALGQNDTIESDKMTLSLGQVVTLEEAKLARSTGQPVTLEKDKMTRAITRDYSDITTENNVQQAERVFESWWNLYDKKRGKAKCNGQFKELLKKYDYTIIEKGTKRYLNYLEQNNISKQYQKDPITFLTGEHFTDEYDERSDCAYLAVNADTPYQELVLNFNED